MNNKTQCFLLLIIWMILTTILALSIIGWILIFKNTNFTQYFKPISELRSTWMSIGFDLKDKVINNNNG